MSGQCGVRDGMRADLDQRMCSERRKLVARERPVRRATEATDVQLSRDLIESAALLNRRQRHQMLPESQVGRLPGSGRRFDVRPPPREAVSDFSGVSVGFVECNFDQL
jgi:hypothetical protein